MRFAYIEGSVPGAIPNGTKIRKKIQEDKDGHPVGSLGTVISSMGPVTYNNITCIGYFVAWDDRPTLPVFIVGWKIEEAK